MKGLPLFHLLMDSGLVVSFFGFALYIAYSIYEQKESKLSVKVAKIIITLYLDFSCAFIILSSKVGSVAGYIMGAALAFFAILVLIALLKLKGQERKEMRMVNGIVFLLVIGSIRLAFPVLFSGYGSILGFILVFAGVILTIEGLTFLHNQDKLEKQQAQPKKGLTAEPTVIYFGEDSPKIYPEVFAVVSDRTGRKHEVPIDMSDTRPGT